MFSNHYIESETESEESESEEEETESETESESEDDIIILSECDDISDHEEHMDIIHPIQMIQGNYYIGCYKIITYEQSILLLANKIHTQTFMKYNGYQLSKYFFWYSGLPFPKLPSIDILKLYIDEYDTYTVVIKTFWIKIIQRTWKRVFTERKKYINYRKQLSTIRRYEIGTSMSISIPGVKGMLNFSHK